MMEWKSVTLEDVCLSIFAGGDVPKNKLSKTKTPKFCIPIFGNGEKLDGLYGYTDQARVNEPSVTVSARGTIGYSVIRHEPYFPVVRLIVLIPNSKLILLKYLYYAIASMKFVNSGTSIPQLTVPMIKNYRLALPPIDEQKRIVAMLDEAFADIEKARELTEQNLKNARELFDSYLSQTFESRTEKWHKQKFGEVCYFVRGPFGGALKKSIFKPEGFAVYEQQHAIYDQFRDVRYFVDGEKFEQMSRFELLPGDLIISCSGTMGKIAIAPPNIKRGIINQALLKLTPKLGITAQFLKIWMESPNFQREIESRAQGAAIKNMASVKVLKDIFIPIPSAVVQHEIVDLHDRLKTLTSSLESNYMTKLSELSKLKESMLSQQFQGV